MTVDTELLAAANDAVERGSADSVSAWVNDALAVKAERESKLAAMAEAVADYEAQYGKITEAEIAAQHRADRENVIRVRGRVPDEFRELDRRNQRKS